MPGWDSAYQQIRRMVARAEIKLVPCKVHGKIIPQVPRLVMLSRETAPSYQKWEHEIVRSACYVALHSTGKLIGYRSKWTTEEYREFAKSHGVYFDSQFELQGSKFTFFLEVDMGTEYWENELNEKVAEYAGLAQSMPQFPFYVVFVAKTREGTDRGARLKAFGQCFRQHGRGMNFVVTDLDLFTNNPLGKILASDRLTEPASLLDLA